MLRWLLRTPSFLARQAKRTKRSTAPSDDNDEEAEEKGRTFKSEYHRFKDNYLKLDQLNKQETTGSEQLNLTMKFLQEMMKNPGGNQEGPLKKKQKVDIREKLKTMGTPEHLLKEETVIPPQQLLSSQKKQTQISEENIDRSPQSQQQRQIFQKITENLAKDKQLSPEQYKKMEEIELKLAQQDMLLKEIMENSKEKELSHINKVQQKTDLLGMTEKERKLMLRQQKILEALQNKEDPSQKKYTITHDDLIAMRYSAEIIEKAKDFKNNELSYLKDLIINQNQDTNQNSVLKRRFLNKQQEKRWKLLNQKPPEKIPPESTYKTSRMEEGLVQYQDTEFYMKKAEKQLKEKEQLDEADKLIISQLNKDLEIGNKISDVFLDQVVYKNEAKIDRSIALQESSFGRQQQEMRNLTKRLEKLGINYQPAEIKELSKLSLFEQKKYLENQQRYQKYLHQKEKRKNMKKQLRQIHETKLRDDLDFNKQQEKVMTVKQIKQSNSFSELEDNYEKMNEYREQKAATTVNETHDEKMSKIHHKKTFKNMKNVLSMYFSHGLFNHGVGQLEEVGFKDVIPNRTNTVLNIFWDIEPKYLQEKGIIEGSDDYQQKFQQLKKKTEERLNKQAPYISGKMTQFLRLRYGPDIRFHYDRKTRETEEAIDELGKYVKEIAMEQLKDYIKKGNIKTVEQEVEYFQKLLVVAKEKLHDFNSRKQLLSKGFQQYQKRKENIVQRQLKKNKDKEDNNENTEQINLKKKKKRNPLYEDQDDFIVPGEEKKVQKKKKASQKFWDTIDML